MIAAIEALSGDRALDFVSCPIFSHIHSIGLGEISERPHSKHWYLMYSHDFYTAMNI